MLNNIYEKQAERKSCVPLKTIKGSRFFWQGNRPFFWLGDTAWLAAEKLTREEIDTYLLNRKEKGFRVIQTVAIHHFPAVNYYGRNAFTDNNPELPDTEGQDSYWSVLDYMIEKADSLGIYIALLPHWGNLSEQISMESMEKYVRFLAQRYGKYNNLLWVTGGDIRGDQKPEYWRKMGTLLKNLCPEQLVTFHPFGRTSSLDYFGEEEWLDFHMFQSGHRRYDQRKLGSWDDSNKDRYYGEDNWQYVKDGQKLNRKLPILDGEPSYEHIPQGLHDGNQPFWSPEQVRRYGWWSVLSGAAGFTYGHNSIMQFYDGTGSGDFSVKYSWQDALHAPGAASVCRMSGIMQEIFDEIAEDAVRNQQAPAEAMEKNCYSCESLLCGSSAWKENMQEERIMAYAAGNYLLCYSYTGREICINPMSDCIAWWIDPSDGTISRIGKIRNTEEGMKFTAPQGDFQHKDWALLLKKL